MRNEYEVRRAWNGDLIGEFLDFDAARRFAQQFVYSPVEVWRKAGRDLKAELVAEYGGGAMTVREPSGPHYYTVRPVGVNGNRPHGGITTETVARRIAAHYLKCGATYVAIEHQGSTIVEYGTPPPPDME